MRGSILMLALLATPAWAQRMPPRGSMRATVARDARVSLSRTGPWLPVAAAAERGLDITDASGTRLQFVNVDGAMELVMYVERDALQPVALRGARLTPRPVLDANAGTSSPGMVLPAGT